MRGSPTPSTHLRLTSAHLCSPALRVGAGKSGVGEGEWKVSSMQISVVLFRQENTFLHRAHPPLRAKGEAALSARD
jgi:hypothetical protein